MLSESKSVRDTAHMKCFDPKDENGQAVGGVLPADIDGGTMPSDGAPEYILGFGVDQLRFWRIKMDWAHVDNSTISGPTLIPVETFEPASCGKPRDACVPQKDTTSLLEALPDRMMYRLAYRRFADRESLFANHSVEADKRYGIRWYELSRPVPAENNAEFTVRQQQTFSPDGLYRWIGSIAADKFGNVLLVYNTSSADSYPSLRFAGQQSGDALSALSQEGIISEGKRSVNGTRWGDYSSLSLDPTDDCTFWVTGEYLSGDNPPSGPAIAQNEIRSVDQPTVAAPTSTKTAALLSSNVVTGYYWDTTIASIRFPQCKQN